MIRELKLNDCDEIKVKAKVSNLKGKYNRAVDWRSKTGAGVLETEGPASVQGKSIPQKT